MTKQRSTEECFIASHEGLALTLEEVSETYFSTTMKIYIESIMSSKVVIVVDHILSGKEQYSFSLIVHQETFVSNPTSIYF